MCAIINHGAYYVVGIPSALVFASILHVGGMVRFLYLIFSEVLESIRDMVL